MDLLNDDQIKLDCDWKKINCKLLFCNWIIILSNIWVLRVEHWIEKYESKISQDKILYECEYLGKSLSFLFQLK